jgi:hypothetical protein
MRRFRPSNHRSKLAPSVGLSDPVRIARTIDPPVSEALARGLVVIQYRTENLRIVQVFGPGALDVSPRIGHLHVTVDDAPWPWVDASGEPLIIQGLSPGSHRVLIQLADPTHRVIDQGVVEFVISEK